MARDRDTSLELDDTDGGVDAEEDREFIEDTLLGFLDGNEPVREVRDPYYTLETVDVIEEELGLEHPEDVSFLEYPSGQQMIYDAITQLIENNGLYGEMEESFDEDSSQSFSLLRDPITIAKGIAKYLWMRKKINFQANRVMGIHELNKFTNGGFPVTLNEEIIGYVPDNIGRFAERHDTDEEMALQYVKTHEGIHVVQSYNFPGIRERKAELIDSVAEIEREAVPEDVGDEIQAMMTVVEGHAEYFTNKIVEDRYDIEIDRNTSLKQDTINRIFGFKEKRDQYLEGSNLIAELYDIGGLDLAHEPLRDLPQSMEDIGTSTWT